MIVFKIKTACIYIIVSNSCMFAMYNGTVVSAAIQHQQANIVSIASPVTIIHHYGEHKESVFFKKPKMYYESQSVFLDYAAQQEIDMRERKVKIMSNHINQLYVGEGDSWSLKKQIAVYLGLSGSGYYHIAEAIKDLNAIDSFSGWDRKMIESLRIKNSRFDGLITRLIREKVVKYSLYDHMAGASCICASNIDEFFDERFLFPHLRASLQKYVHYQVEQLYRRIFKLKDHESIIPHALQIVVDRSVKNKEELEALKKSLLFKKYMTKYTH